jgi:hypothetical protein
LHQLACNPTAFTNPNLPLELLGEGRRGHRRRRSADTLETIAHARRVQRLDDFTIEAIDQRARRRGRSEGADPELLVGIGRPQQPSGFAAG